MRLLACLTFAVAPAFAQGVPEGQAVAYGCDGGATLAVAYINPPGGDSYAVVAYDGRLVPMRPGRPARACATSRSTAAGSSGTPRAPRASSPAMPTCR
jgi:hypothetical protein